MSRYVVAIISCGRYLFNLLCPKYISDHISTEGGHAEHVLVTRTNKMDASSTDKQIFGFSSMSRPSEFRAAIYIVKCFRLKVIAEQVDHSTASL